nr:hypothetical protein [Candidatus Gracilibacteria bacterium]
MLVSNPIFCSSSSFGYIGEIEREYIFDRKLLNLPNLQGEGVVTSLGLLVHAVNKGGRGNKMGIVLKKMLDLKKSLETDLRVTNLDPIHYIIELYFGKEPLSLETIFNRLNEKGLNYKDKSGLEKLLKRFGWKLKECEERQGTKKVKVMYPDKAIESAKKKSEECRIKFLTWMIANLNEVEDPYFDIKYLNSLTSSAKKCNYLLKTFYSCELSSFKGKGLGSRSIVMYLQPILNDLTNKLKLSKITITMSGIESYIH